MRIGQAIDKIFQDINKSYEGISEDNFKYKLKYDICNSKIELTTIFGAKINSVLDNRFSEIDWKLIQNSVSFMEAFKALREDKKDVYCEYKGETQYYYESELDTHYFDEDFIAEGKWYIEDNIND